MKQNKSKWNRTNQNDTEQIKMKQNNSKWYRTNQNETEQIKMKQSESKEDKLDKLKSQSIHCNPTNLLGAGRQDPHVGVVQEGHEAVIMPQPLVPGPEVVGDRG